MPEAVQNDFSFAGGSLQEARECLWCHEKFWWPRSGEPFTPCLCIWCFAMKLPARRKR